MQIIETFTESKHKDGNLNEDQLFIGKYLIAVIDGATSKTDETYEGITPGRYAGNVIKEELTEHEEELAKLNAHEFFYHMDHILMQGSEDKDFYAKPRASMIVYNDLTKEIWNYGDCNVRINNKTIYHTKEVDKELSAKRSSRVEWYLENGYTEEELLQKDLARDDIIEDIRASMQEYENLQKPKGYPVLSGMGIVDSFVKIYSAERDCNIILATDGYPYIRNTLEATEQDLKRLLQEDKLCYKENKSTKSYNICQNSFDDRTFIKFRV